MRYNYDFNAEPNKENTSDSHKNESSQNDSKTELNRDNMRKILTNNKVPIKNSISLTIPDLHKRVPFFKPNDIFVEESECQIRRLTADEIANYLKFGILPERFVTRKELTEKS